MVNLMQVMSPIFGHSEPDEDLTHEDDHQPDHVLQDQQQPSSEENENYSDHDHDQQIGAETAQLHANDDQSLDEPHNDVQRIEKEALADYPDNVVKRFVGNKVAADGHLLVTVR